MSSIRTRLTAAVLATSLVLVAAAGAALYLYVRGELIEQFDHSLRAEADALTTLVREDPDGTLDFGFSDAVPPALLKTHHAPFFQITAEDGKVLLRSANLSANELPRSDAGHRLEKAHDVALPGGLPGRAVTVRFFPALDDDDSPAGAAPASRATKPRQPALWLTLARDRREIDQTLDVLLSSMLIAAAGFAVISVAVVILTVRQALRPLLRISDDAERIGPSTLSARFSTDQLPAELLPICQRLNDLLRRLGDAFARERRFTADAAHELRTPLAELRTLAEVALRWPQEPAAAHQGYQDVLAIAQQMERLVNGLLAIARSESGAPHTFESIDLCPLVGDAWQAAEPLARSKRIDFSAELPESARVRGDGAMLGRLLENLIGNAVAYSPPDSQIHCCVSPASTGILFALTNPSREIAPEDLPHLTEPFWRKDASRTDGLHAGLGLAVVAAYCRLMEAELQFDLPAPATFRVLVELPPAGPSAMPSAPVQPLVRVK